MEQFRNFYSEHKGIVMSSFAALLMLGAGVYRLRADSIDETLALVAAVEDSSGVVITRGQLAARDSDRDGLLDWEEIIYGTDQTAQDTDADGTGDGAEVALGRDPKVPNTAKEGETPNDLLSVIAGPKFATSSTDQEGLMKNFYAEYLKNAGTQIREATFNELVSKFNPNEFGIAVTLADLNITTDNTPEAVKAYVNEFGAVIDKYTLHPFRDETEILQEALQKKDSHVLKELQIASVGYRNFSEDLRKIKVPSEVADVHLGIVNAYDVMGRACRAMVFMFDDPIRGSGAYEAYMTHRMNLIPAYGLVIIFTREKGVTFNEGDPGHYFKWRPEWDMGTATPVVADPQTSDVEIVDDLSDIEI